MDNEYFSSINDVSKRLAIPAHTLRYWEKQFPVAIRPTTGAGGRRYYRAETVARLEKIKDLLYNRGMTIAGVKKMMRDGEFLDTSISAPVAAPIVTPDMNSISRSDIDLVLNMLGTARDILTGDE
ncbi:MerR family transcriptional regulator [bacterium]|nr:MerR family transcriptional regulator [bacterium]